jgi:hypothetical protein
MIFSGKADSGLARLRRCGILKPKSEGGMSRKLLVLVVLMTAGIAVAAPGAYAGKPTKMPVVQMNFVDTTSCPFPVAAEVVVNKETAKTFSNGTIIITGRLVVTYSANGKSVTLNISGPGKGFVGPNGSLVIIGHGVGAGPLVTPNGIVLAYTAGIVRISTSPTLEGVLVHGTVRMNICSALAP